MIMYHAGNFPQMKDIESEQKMMNHVFNKGYGKYCRLLSFYYKEDITTVLEATKECEVKEQN